MGARDMVNEKEEERHERITNPPRKKGSQKIYPQHKLQILKEWEVMGNGIEVAQKYQIHPQTLYRWKEALHLGVQIFLSGKKAHIDARIRQLEAENRKLKEALALQAKELMLLIKEMD